MNNPYESPKPNPFSDQAPMMPPVAPSSGMVQQVQVIGILMIVQGILATCMGLGLIGTAAFIPAMLSMEPPSSQGTPPPKEMMWVMSAVYGSIGSLTLIGAILLIVAGVKNYRFRSRTLGIVALVMGLSSVFTCYCGFTAIGLAVYGLIVLLNREVAMAFEMGKQGMNRDEILAAIHQQRYNYMPPMQSPPM